jgi:ribonuclease BN (tRNA processing enzyme)
VMELRVLGCHGGETPKHRTSSFLVDGRIGIDAGAITSMLALDEQHGIETVLISHAHMDHVRDLATLADNRCQQGGPTLRIASTAGTLAILKKHFFNDKLWPDFSRIPAGKSGMTISYQLLKAEKPLDLGRGVSVRAVHVDHTVETCGFVLSTPDGSIAYSGDTGPTGRIWEILQKEENLRALLMEVSFPNEQHKLAKVSGHHTPETLDKELKKLRDHKGLPVMLYHIKPVFEQRVEKELARLRARDLTILRLGDQFVL